MKKEDVEIGMKVKVHKKSIGCPLSQSDVYISAEKNNQKFLYVAHQHMSDKGTDKFLLHNDEDCISWCGDYFSCLDFEPYVENK